MSDESEPITAVAKAVEETAKTGRALVEAGSDLAKFVGKALGTVPEDTIGLLGGNYLHHLRIRNLDKISRKTEEILRKRGVEEPEPIGPKALLPALEAASEETDETLQDMWAELLANAMDPDHDVSLQHIFIDTLKQLEPIDVRILSAFLEVGGNNEQTPKKLAPTIGLRVTEVIVSAERLVSLSCLSNVSRDSFSVGAPETLYMASALARELSRACSSPATS